jgi:hypothetical protein
MPLKEEIGLDSIVREQQIWRFQPMWKARDFLETRELYLTQVSELRKEDPQEARLPAVLKESFSRLQVPAAGRQLLNEFIRVCEDQATGVFASCWFLPGSPSHEKRMWAKYGGGSEGGLVLITTLGRLISSLPDDMMLSFGIGSIRYIPPTMSYFEAFHLNEYRSAPFLLKLHDHQDDREIRVYQRYRGPLRHPHCLRPRINVTKLLQGIRLSPLCSEKIKKEIYDELVGYGLPKKLIKKELTRPSSQRAARVG